MEEDRLDPRIGCAFFLVVFLLFAAISFVASVVNQQDITGTVESTYIKRVADSDRFYVVLRDDFDRQHVLQNVDSFWWGKWTSADDQARMQEGARVRVHTAGYRFPVLSWFPNIVRVDVLHYKPRRK